MSNCLLLRCVALRQLLARGMKTGVIAYLTNKNTRAPNATPPAARPTLPPRPCSPELNTAGASELLD